MDALATVQYVLGFGAAVFMPVVLFIIGLIVGLGPSRAFRAGLTIGVAFTAMSLVIGGLFYAQVAPAATAMVERLGLQLSMLDIGWTPASAIAWAWPGAVGMFVVQIGLNLVLLALGWCKTLNVDMFNVWVKAYLGALTFAITGNIWLAFLFAAVMVVIELKLADWTAHMVQEYVHVPGIAVPHSNVLGLLIGAPINAILDHIPFIDKIKLDPKGLRERFGVFGESMVLGLIIGLIVGLLAGYDLQKLLTLCISTASALVLMPKMAALFMDALAPISSAAGAFMKSRFPGREFYIGLDWPILAGNPSTYAVGILAIPFMIVMMVILPGNHTLIFGGIADWAWMVSMIGVMAGGDIIRMMVISLVAVMPFYLYTSTYLAPAVTQVAGQLAFKMPANATTITWFGSSPLNLFLLKIAELNPLSIVWLVALVAMFWFARYHLVPKNAEAKNRVDAEFGLAPAAEPAAETAPAPAAE